MSGNSINIGDKKINKSNFYKNKKIFKIDDIDVNKILVSKKESYGTKNLSKYFIGYNDGYDVIRLYIKLPQKTGYAKYFDGNKTIYLFLFQRFECTTLIIKELLLNLLHFIFTNIAVFIKP